VLDENLRFYQERRQKNFQGGGQRKRRPKNSTIKPLPEGEATEKDRKIAKIKTEKYHV